MASVKTFFGEKNKWEKYRMPAYEVFSESMRNSTELTWNVGSVSNPNVIKARISKTAKNGQTLNEFIENGKTFDQIRRLEVTTNHPEKKRIRLGDIPKQLLKEGGPQFNRGHIGEGVLAAALTARFQNKLAFTISEAEIKNVLLQTKPQGGKIDQTFKGPNKNEKIFDDIQLKINLPDHEMVALHDQKILDGSAMSGIVKGAAKYANARHVKKFAKLVYNSVYDHILIDSDGVGNQKGTKVDVKVTLNHKAEHALNVSLKVGGIGQIGGVGGGTIDKFKMLFELLGITVDSGIETKFNKKLKDGDHYGAVVVMYEEVARVLQQKLAGPSGAIFFEALGDFTLFFATRNEPDVDLIDLDRDDYKLYKFGEIKDRLSNMKFKVGVRTSLNKKLVGWGAKTMVSPTLFIASDQSQNIFTDNFISIRSAIEGREDKPYFRNKVEKGKQMYAYLREEA